MAGSGAAVSPTSTDLVDLTDPRLSGELAKVEARLHVLQGILDALGRWAQVNRTVQMSADRFSALRALQARPYSYSQQQAQAVLDMPVGWQCLEHSESLRREYDELTSQRARMSDHVSEMVALHWFG